MKIMSTENNSDLLFNNSVKILTDLIGFKTISGEDNTALIDYCDDILKKLGATSFRTYDDKKKRVNLLQFWLNQAITHHNFGSPYALAAIL